MDIRLILDSCRGFQWDQGNGLKNWLKHGITQIESEQVLLNEPLLVSMDEKHSQQENRFRAMGYTDENRYLYVVFTVRDDLIRVISARDMNRKERVIYEKFKTDTEIQ